MTRQLQREEYTVGWVCALDVELAATQEILDEEHKDLEQNEHDDNQYSLGRIGEYNIVIIYLPIGLIGSNPAATVATQIRSTFTSIRFILMVGIGGGVPSAEVDIRLGDVVVSQPHKRNGEVIQYDFGKTTPSGFQHIGFLNSPPAILLKAVTNLRANHIRAEGKFLEYNSILHRLPKFTREAAGPDVLFHATYDHKGGSTYQHYKLEKQVNRQPRGKDISVIHYGIITSGNRVLKDAAERDGVSGELGGVLCFKMEAAGLMNSFPCLVMRGICDYADSHKNKIS
ncbi:uncharacterized protein A1O5_11571 [Cladophialophora psammophila CBS 110553]|uniref:Nucleoside phosphorylase domain-containing protein n=1 Tax=Cladophialophora psammophila CBS 110553 TaxID=1182543 RepID=W9W5Z3_9EURO|nr:uncharacterized protein A1O5_11571 [Cladophialophora psammophila CBS 110553]EXJ63522.1 hypothetical protein A1O5_11571 [Cladophialophora psammophila CBS 110553]